ncbi:MAG: UDP-N-acetylmuramoylalanyl-D-glutamyl-2,6-diaminopimelate--D-alanyl-D-alanyl ligase [Candidatus Taylorbacteria bacterium]|nr:UDP-N-acetylmuramoylalanyl-D-glutamyl-2,6-diaminopimelate--D-alanyl-D-alanyl ligase [Candidatus Taylorbacteria bacterium]
MKNILKKIVVKIITIEAKLVLKKYKPKIVAVTGSVGKTSTKDAIYTALSPFFFVRKSAKSFNSDIGIPLTILGLPNAWNDHKLWFKNMYDAFWLVVSKSKYPEWLVLEIGADHPGEIEEVMKWIHPDISVITRIGNVPVHVEFYKSVAEVIKEKSYLARGLKPEGTLILNADDSDVMGFKEFTSAKVSTFGIKEKSDIKASFIQPIYKNEKVNGVSFKIDVLGSSIPVTLENIYGNQFVYPVLASFAVVHALGLSPLKAVESFDSYEYPRGRMNIISGINDSVIIDDTYNASPVAMEEGFNAVKGLNCVGKKIAIVGDMLELGKLSQDEHHRLGILAGEIFEMIGLVGIRAKEMKGALQEIGFEEKNIFVFENSVDAGETMKEKISKGDIVYVKGSQGMRLERVVERIMSDPKQKEKLLVRQEKEWVSR